jgi:uncharacterized protein YtpQ (UPF0354 family)
MQRFWKSYVAVVKEKQPILEDYRKETLRVTSTTNNTIKIKLLLKQIRNFEHLEETEIEEMKQYSEEEKLLIIAELNSVLKWFVDEFC